MVVMLYIPWDAQNISFCTEALMYWFPIIYHLSLWAMVAKKIFSSTFNSKIGLNFFRSQESLGIKMPLACFHSSLTVPASHAFFQELLINQIRNSVGSWCRFVSSLFHNSINFLKLLNKLHRRSMLAKVRLGVVLFQLMSWMYLWKNWLLHGMAWHYFFCLSLSAWLKSAAHSLTSLHKIERPSLMPSPTKYFLFLSGSLYLPLPSALVFCCLLGTFD